ncbi:34663_t:CDS:2 [Gigaspora margarita]|uniref:34663_t:CDS:1 n=1 Tax=Gigaspora margarita TaxID=4874 RepID=A0ABN7V555_GIGMA|nr:34663_t:CDS:2 [Gigaspora margarita]
MNTYKTEQVSDSYHLTPVVFKQPDDEVQSLLSSEGWFFRPPEHGHVITNSEMMFAVNVFLLGYNVLKNAKAGVSTSTYHIVLYEACTDRYVIEQFDFCAASRLIWGLIGGAVIYFIFTSIIAVALFFELRRKGFHASFTALWHSPMFLICYFYPPKKRVDILSIPNKYVGLSLWTRSQIHRISLALYCLICTILIFNSLFHGTAESSKIQGEGFDEGYKKFYITITYIQFIRSRLQSILNPILSCSLHFSKNIIGNASYYNSRQGS